MTALALPSSSFGRLRDLVHVVTGYDTDEIGEVEVQCFNLGNMPWGPIPFITIIGAAIVGAYRRNGGFFHVRPRLVAAYRRGRAARCLADVIWEEHHQGLRP